MPFLRRKSQATEQGRPDPEQNERLVKDFLRGQNMEQVGRAEEAIPLYEAAVSAGFDAAGPYDRLIYLYQERRRHADVIRIAEASLASVRTHPMKRIWYEEQIEAARRESGATD